MVVLLPSFAQDFEQIAKFVPASSLEPGASSPWQHYVGNPKFDDFSELRYGEGYQVYCKASAPVTVSIKGRLPTRQLSKALSVGWHLVGSTVLADTPLATWLAGVSYAEVREHNSADNALSAASQAKPNNAYWVRVSAQSTWTPPLPRNVTTSFIYDGDGGRLKKITSTGTTTFLGQSYEKDPTGKTTKYVFAGSQRIAAKDFTGALRFYHGDHLGSSNVTTDGAGAQVELAEYTPYGSLSKREGTANVPQKFTGQRLDTESGLYFYNARYYDPELGRFIQADPFVQHPDDPQDLNRYAYARNNPINLVDPTGYGWLRKLLAIVVAIVATILLPEGAGVWWKMAASVIGTAIGDQVGRAIENRPRESSGGGTIPQQLSIPNWNPGTFASAGSGQPPLQEVSDTLPARGPPGTADDQELTQQLMEDLGLSSKAAQIEAKQFRQSVSQLATPTHWGPKWLEVLVPGYGWYGGPYRTESTHTISPEDSLDGVFKQHDIDWLKGDIGKADRVVLGQLLTLPRNPNRWDKPPENSFKARAYRNLAISYFWGITALRDQKMKARNLRK